jgi:hypothetical protein
MDQFDYSDEALQPTRDSAAIIWNILTVVVLLLTMCVCVGVTAILVNPQVSFNPFPPPTLPVEVEFPTVTPTPRSVLPATWTPTLTSLPTLTPAPTRTLVPTATQPADTLTPVVGTPSVTPGDGEPTTTQEVNTATPSPTEGMPFVLHPGDPVAIQNIGNPELGCNWMGVAGQAFDLSLAPIEEGLFIQLGGILGDELVEMLGMVGMVDTYGPGSYEFELGEEPIESSQTLWVQLFDQAMLPLSEQISFDTFADCEKNLILIHFNQVR